MKNATLHLTKEQYQALDARTYSNEPAEAMFTQKELDAYINYIQKDIVAKIKK